MTVENPGSFNDFTPVDPDRKEAEYTEALTRYRDDVVPAVASIVVSADLLELQQQLTA